jgi:GNAT superfamily N-acetyltransferase
LIANSPAAIDEFELHPGRIALYKGMCIIKKQEVGNSEGLPPSMAVGARLPGMIGAVTDPSGYRFFLQATRDGQIRRVILRHEKSVPRKNRDIIVYPAYEVTEILQVPGVGSINLRLKAVERDAEQVCASHIILRTHYLEPPLRGIILGCYFDDKKQQEAIRKRARRVLPIREPWSEAWIEPPGRMIACAVLSTLWHGNPRGRIDIAKSEGKEDLLISRQQDEGQRRRIVEGLGLAWAARFAVDAPYRGLGLGTVLARRVLEVAANHRVPPARYVEVMTTHPIAEARELLEEKKGFLNKAGYSRFAEVLRSKPMLLGDSSAEQQGQKTHSVGAKKLYYYRRTDGPL